MQVNHGRPWSLIEIKDSQHGHGENSQTIRKENIMTQGVTKLPVAKENRLEPQEAASWRPLLSLQREINQVFDQFDRNWSRSLTSLTETGGHSSHTRFSILSRRLAWRLHGRRWRSTSSTRRKPMR